MDCATSNSSLTLISKSMWSFFCSHYILTYTAASLPVHHVCAWMHMQYLVYWSPEQSTVCSSLLHIWYLETTPKVNKINDALCLCTATGKLLLSYTYFRQTSSLRNDDKALKNAKYFVCVVLRCQYHYGSTLGMLTNKYEVAVFFPLSKEQYVGKFG